MGITILEFDQIGWNDPAKAQEYDLKYEDYQKSLDPNSPVILDSRLWFWCQPKAFKVYLNVSDEAWAQRVYAAQRDDDANESLEAVLEANISRNAWHKKTYMKLYNVDLFDEKNYDLYIDTSNLSPDEVYIQVLEGYENFKK